MDIEQRQLAKKRLLLDLKEILDDMDVLFWLHSGVLLGYYREHDLIKHDPDLDLGVLASGLPDDFAGKFARRLEGTNMRLGWKTKTCLKVYTEDGLARCDIFLHSGNLPNLTLDLYTSTECVSYKYSISGFVRVPFLGTQFLIPNNPKEVLFKQYGSSWNIPKTEFKWDEDPCNIAGKPDLELDETPKKPVLEHIVEPSEFTVVFGPVTKQDISHLENCKKAVVFAEQPESLSHKNVQVVHCDETHYVLRPDQTGFEKAIIPYPGRYSPDNFRNMLRTVWSGMKDGGELIFRDPAHLQIVSEFMFKRTSEFTFKKYTMSDNWEKNVTAVVTTYESPDMARECVGAIKKHYPDMRIVVVDNSKTPTKIAGVKFVELPEDAGLSASRNAGLLYVNTPYVFITDDDQYVTDSSSVKRMYESVINNKLDLVGGSVVHSVSKIPAIYTGTMTRKPDRVELIRGKYRTLADGTDIVDVTMNFFVAKMEIFKKIQWNRNLKICEHMDFFMKAQDLGLKIGNIPAASCLHMKNRGLRTKEYQIQRKRYDYFTNRCMRMNGLKEYTSFDGGRVVYPVSTQKGDGVQTGNAERRNPGTYRSCREAARVWSSRH